ncbi:rhomboid family intramembrane serine protease [Roseobacter sinensis]|uniref:Rhomboid family intramembrane serine protease n=1 Tax=Roseobacter sinensis TaxID=2931391 RepID=A0ABT3BCW1_9RHOB|nr:rhomboid family intramembrane serine protease [Roseobacter sp. WL0113]MCV3271417.1 rhomboid family intramembrane serine protease [Roseobacter sp. WL0113]
MHDHQDPSPVNPLPLVVVILFLAIALPEAAFGLGARGLIGGTEAVGWRLASVQAYAFSGDIFDWMVTNGRWLPEHLLRFLTYSFVHTSFTSALFAGVLLLALGKLVGETMGQVAVLVLFFGGAVFGALVYALLLNDPTWLVGGFPAVYGLIGGYSFVMWQSLAARGEEQLRAFSLIAILMGLQLIWGIFFDVGNGWVADLAAFFFGFGASATLVPGGIARVLAALRRD